MDQYDAFTVPSAEKMYQFLEKTLPDLILLDVLMPEIDGYEAILRLKKDNATRGIPVIFLTSKSDTESEVKGLSLGAADYISKPFAPHLLLKRIEMHLLVETQKAELQYINDNLQALVERKTRTVLDLQNSIILTVSGLVESRDDVTGGHILRTARTLRFLIEEMTELGVYRNEVETWDIDLFLQSSQLHDVGKISIHDSILLKPSQLTPEEYEEMKKHTTFGEKIIDKIQASSNENAFLTHAKIMAGTHHEKWDGSGYPYHLSGPTIPLQGRLMAIADVYDALVSRRPYKEPFSHEKAVEIIASGCGTHFDPALSNVFLAAAQRF
jgi:putative two-component system response regulator